MRISGFDAVSYQAGDVVTVSGGNFLATGSNPTVKIGLLPVVAGLVTATSFQFTVPDSGVTAAVSATNANGSTSSASALKVRPTISGEIGRASWRERGTIAIVGQTCRGKRTEW